MYSYSNSPNRDVFSTVENKASWNPGPNTRGTYDILIVCTSTILFAVWTVYHPNVTRSILPQSRRVKGLRHAGMIGLFLLAPELLPIVAAIELKKALDLYNRVRSLSRFQNSGVSRTDLSTYISKANRP